MATMDAQQGAHGGDEGRAIGVEYCPGRIGCPGCDWAVGHARYCGDGYVMWWTDPPSCRHRVYPDVETSLGEEHVLGLEGVALDARRLRQ